MVTDAELRPVSWNASALRILGVSAEQLAADGLVARRRSARCVTATATCHHRRQPAGACSAAGRAGPRDAAPHPTTRAAERWITVLARPIGGAHGTSRQGVVCTFADVTSSVEAERRLRAERDRAQHYLDVAGTLLRRARPTQAVELINRQGCELLGYEERRAARQRLVRRGRPRATTAPTRALAFTRVCVGGVEPLDRPPGDRQHADRRARARSPGATRRCATTTGSVTGDRSPPARTSPSAARAEEQISCLAYHDPLTGLPNRAQLEAQLAPRARRAARRAGARGRAAARRPRQLQARQRLASATAPATGCCAEPALRGCASGRGRDRADLLARHGGDEFLLLLRRPRRTTARRPPRAARRAQVGRRALAEPFKVAGAEFHVDASIGISLYPERRATPDDAAPARRHGDVPEQGPRAAAVDRLRARQRTTRSSACRCRRGCGARSPASELVLHYQPIVDARRPARSTRWRRCCAGTTPTAGSSTAGRRSSPPPRRRPARADRRLGDRRARAADRRVARAGPAAAASASTSRRASCTGPTSPPSWPRGWPTLGDRPGAADDGADRVGAAARAGADRRRSCASCSEPGLRLAHRRLRRRLVLALAAARAAGAHRSRSTARSCARVPEDPEAGAIVAAVIALAERSA